MFRFLKSFSSFEVTMLIGTIIIALGASMLVKFFMLRRVPKGRMDVDYSTVVLYDAAQRLYHEFFQCLDSRSFSNISKICSHSMIEKMNGMQLVGTYKPLIRSCSLLRKSDASFEYLFISEEKDLNAVRRTIMEFCCIDGKILIDDARDE